MATQSSRRMPLVAALEALAAVREDRVVVTTMGSAREWPKLSTHPLDFHYIPSAMGHAPMLGLGLAMARPAREVIVLNGDGCMLMSLGELVTIVAAGAANYTLAVLENGIYEVTGGQRTAAGGDGVAIDFEAMARAAGFKSTATFGDLADWKAGAAALLESPGPRFVVLKTEPVGASYHLDSPGPIAERLARFRKALAT